MTLHGPRSIERTASMLGSGVPRPMGGRSATPLRVLVGAALSVLLAACGGGSAGGGGPTAPESREAAIAVDEPIPAPTDEAELVISGAIEVTNSGEELLLDVKTLEQMPLVEATIFEPFLKQDVRFTGVLLSDLFAYVGVGSAERIEMTALDDYQVGFSLAELDADRVLLAVHADGRPIEIADGGPTRIVFLDADQGLGANTDHWIWSVSHMDFEGSR